MIRFERMSGMTMAVLELARIGFAMAGLFLLMVGGSKVYEAYTSQFWPTTTGEITRSVVDVSGDLDGNRRYYSRIKYTYAVKPSMGDQAANDDDTFTSARVGIDPILPEESWAAAEARLAPYPKGSLVEVYYNPNRPEKSMLEPAFSLAYLIRPLVGLLCLGAAISLRKVGRGQ